MKEIILASPWTYHSIELTIDFAAGTHAVSDAVYAAAVAQGVHTEPAKEEESNGNGASSPGPARAARKA